MSIAIIIAVFVVICKAIDFVAGYNRYKTSNYYLSTNNSYLSVYFNKGLYGEYRLYQHLHVFESIGCKFLFNLYVPRDNGKTSEIDVIMFHPKGLFVIESKNYSGWIFGHENNKQWTQTLPTRYGECHKERFYNPIMQNTTHIRAIRKHIDDTIPVYSVIAFSDDCTLKNITVKSKTIVTYYSNLYSAINLKLSEINNYSMTTEQLKNTYNKLAQFTNANNYTKLKHNQDCL
ncbi:MAG: NERD domain-containing protein [Candidatus Gastranaerophilales bacterium]|nr:NERD domain-containing protein [Candidatus Gastranaerophilales bacterium]MCM1074005.1 NERD domain-containing protein [Bacteroides sp.]